MNGLWPGVLELLEDGMSVPELLLFGGLLGCGKREVAHLIVLLV